jgi:hypothetical protein
MDERRKQSMTDKLDLTGEIAEAVDGAALRGKTLALAYQGEDGYPAVSFRGSTQVYGPQQLAIWARKADEGFAKAVAERPQVSLVYYGGPDGPGPMFLSFKGRAHVDPSANEQVWSRMIEGEQQQDADRRGVAVIVEVERAEGFAATGPFVIERDQGV